LLEADGAGGGEQSQGFLLLGEVAEFGVVGIVGGDEGLFAVEDGWVVGVAVGAAADCSGGHVYLEAQIQGGVGVIVEVGIEEVGHPGRLEVEFDQGEALRQGIAAQGIAAAGFPGLQALAGELLDLLEQGVEGGQGGVVDVEGGGQQLADGTALAALGPVRQRRTLREGGGEGGSKCWHRWKPWCDSRFPYPTGGGAIRPIPTCRAVCLTLASHRTSASVRRYIQPNSSRLGGRNAKLGWVTIQKLKLTNCNVLCPNAAALLFVAPGSIARKLLG